jgi:hypothetical protein
MEAFNGNVKQSESGPVSSGKPDGIGRLLKGVYVKERASEMEQECNRLPDWKKKLIMGLDSFKRENGLLLGYYS